MPPTVTFAQAERMTPDTDSKTHLVTCNKCRECRHYANMCPIKDTAIQLMQIVSQQVEEITYNFAFAQNSCQNIIIPDMWLLLNSQSTVSVFKNARFLSNIRELNQKLVVYTNGGIQTLTMIGDLSNFGTVWYNPSLLANILSLAQVQKLS